MMEEIREADRKFAEKTGKDSDGYNYGLRFRPGAEEDFRSASSPYGTLHDSRRGASVLYRYSPRKIETKGNGTESIHDVIVHHSVIKRILDCSDSYAPVNLPHDGKVLRADHAIVPLREYLEVRSTYSQSEPSSAVSGYQQKQEHLLNLVLRRQASYFLLLFTLVAIVAMPVWDSLMGSVPAPLSSSVASVIRDTDFTPSDIIEGINAFVGPVVGALKFVTPSYVDPYLDCLHRYPIVFLALVGLAFWFYVRGNKLRDNIRDHAREIWKPSSGVLEHVVSKMPQSQKRLSRFRQRLADSVWSFYRKVTGAMGNNGLDLAKIFGEIAIVMGFALVIFVGTVGLSRVWFNIKLGSGKVCSNTEPKKLRWLASNENISIPDVSGPNTGLFTTSSPCWPSAMAVEKGIAYRLRIDVNLDDPWFDGPIMSDVEGFASDGLIRKLFKSPFLRWQSAGWFQPIARIGNSGDIEWPLVPNDGSGPIPEDNAGCKRMPQSYFDTPEFCEAHQKAHPCPEESTKASAELNVSVFGPSRPLPEYELPFARKAWLKSDGVWHQFGIWHQFNLQSDTVCRSSYPRKTLVSDFVAQKTGELFLFVNDAMPWLFGADDSHYQNNRGSAKITLMRAPLFSTSIVRAQN